MCVHFREKQCVLEGKVCLIYRVYIVSVRGRGRESYGVCVCVRN